MNVSQLLDEGRIVLLVAGELEIAVLDDEHALKMGWFK
jgi:hypothetical protein